MTGLRKQLETAKQTVSKAGSAFRLRKQTTGSEKAIVAAAGIAAMGAVGVAAARMRKKRAANGALDSVTTFRLSADGENGWLLSRDGNGEHQWFGNKRHALREARRTAASAQPSRLVVHATDGRVQQMHAY
jgi:Uncharacterized protein conserved in bacteria (DUF2188)